MFDTHLINVALAGLSISAGVAILMAAAIIGIALRVRTHPMLGSSVTGAGTGAPVSTIAASAPAAPERLAA